MGESEYCHFAIPIDLMEPDCEWQWLQTLETSEKQIL